jgi:hypothetical protein
MKIRYDNTIEDMIAFNRYHIAHSPALWSQRAVYAFVAWGLPAVLVPVLLLTVAAAALEGIAIERSVAIVVIFALVAVGSLVIVLWARRIRRRISGTIDGQVRRLYGEGENKGVLTTHELELTGTSLIERTIFGETITKFEAVERVVDAGDFILIYLTALSAHVIPRHAVSEGDYGEFVEAVAQRVDRTNHIYRVE